MSNHDLTSLPTLQASPPSDATHEVVAGHFSHAPSWALLQTWNNSPDANFARGQVHLAQHDESLWIFAALEDHFIGTRATSDGQMLWELGDCFEIFLGADVISPYLEIHLAPNGFSLELAWGEEGNARPNLKLEEVMTSGLLGARRVWSEAQNKRWFALAQIPFAGFLAQSQNEFLASFSRYDYSGSGEEFELQRPILSSTSPHSSGEDNWPSFHCRAEWRTLRR